MTSIAIQFVRLVAPALLRKSSELQQEGYLLKTILLSWLFRALWNWLSPRDMISSIVPVIHNARGGGGESAYERGRDARRKFWIKPLKETYLGVAQAFFVP